MQAMFQRYWRYLCLGFLAILAIIATWFNTSSEWQQKDAVLQIHMAEHGESLPDGFYLYQHLAAEGVTIKSITPEKDTLVIRCNSTQDCEAAQRVLKKLFQKDFTIS